MAKQDGDDISNSDYLAQMEVEGDEYYPMADDFYSGDSSFEIGDDYSDTELYFNNESDEHEKVNKFHVEKEVFNTVKRDHYGNSIIDAHSEKVKRVCCDRYCFNVIEDLSLSLKDEIRSKYRQGCIFF